MRILLTTYLLRSGVLTHVWDLVQHLNDMKIDVSVAILAKKNTQGKSGTHWSNNADVKLLGPIRQVPFCFYNTEEELISFCKKQVIQLIHAHSRLAYPTSHKVAAALGLPLVLTLHGVYPWESEYPDTIKAAKNIIAIGPAQAEHTSIATCKVTMIPNGINTERFVPPKIVEDKYAPLTVLWFGRTHGTASRGVLCLDKAIQTLQKKRLHVNGYVIGSPSGITVDALSSLGWVDDPVLLLQRGQMTFGHGRSLREAMACGNVGFLLGYGYGGHINAEWLAKDPTRPVSAIPEYNLPLPLPEQIAEDISRFYYDRTALAQARNEARQLATQYFNIKTMVKEVIKLYKSSL